MNALNDGSRVVDEVRADLSEDFICDILPRSAESKGFQCVLALLDLDLRVGIGIYNGWRDEVERLF